MTKVTLPAAQGLLDTSVFIAREVGRSVREDLLPLAAAVSVITMAELRAGILVASDTRTRALRLATVERIAREGMKILPVDSTTAEWWAVARVALAQATRHVNVNDLWIAATADARGIPVVTKDNDFEPLEETTNLVVIRV